MVATIKYDVTLKPRGCLVKNAKEIIAYWGDIKKGSTLLIKVDPLVFEYLIFNHQPVTSLFQECNSECNKLRGEAKATHLLIEPQPR